jgi:hypothetical protein
MTERTLQENEIGSTGSRLRWFVLLWLLGVVLVGLVASVVKVLMLGAVLMR